MRVAFPFGLALCAAVVGAAAAQEVAPPAPAIEATPLPEPPSAPPLAPEAAAFRADLVTALTETEAKVRDAVLGFYAERDFLPFWTEEGRAAALEALVAGGAEHGLPPERYRTPIEGEDTAAAREAALSRSYLLLGRDLAGGLLTPSEITAEITLEPDRPDDAALMARLDAGSVEQAVEGLAPRAPEYRALIAEKARLEAVAGAGGWGEPVPDGGALREGDREPRVAALRARLARLGFPAAAVEVEAGDEVAGSADPTFFDAGLAAALQAFQRQFGLLDDGIAGTQTLTAVNTGVDDRIGQILVNLERLRWLGELGERHVYVNIPAYTVSVFEGEERVYHTRSVVGTQETPTPEFSETMTYLVVNPTWYIPDSIARRVYLPKLRTDPGVIARSNMRLFTRSGTEIDPALVDFSRLEAGAFPFRVRQNPSPSNALGRVKFMFPNQFAIYLHDTPARELFDRDARAFSNGCVRLEDPLAFAHYLLAPQLQDPEATFAGWVEAGNEHYVTLEEPIRVHITYRTAWVDPEAGVQYRADVYGRDRAVLAALAKQGVSVPRLRG